MNNNALRSIIDILTVAILGLTALGCTVDDPATTIIEPTKCAIPFLSPMWNIVAAGSLQVIGFVIKGARPGGFIAAWFNKTAVVVAPIDNTVGTVTARDVATP